MRSIINEKLVYLYIKFFLDGQTNITQLFTVFKWKRFLKPVFQNICARHFHSMPAGLKKGSSTHFCSTSRIFLEHKCGSVARRTQQKTGNIGKFQILFRNS